MVRFAKLLLPAVLLGATSVAPLAAQAQLPESKGAPKVGEPAPDFTLPDSGGKPFRLSEALAGLKEKKGKGILLVFYRGYW